MGIEALELAHGLGVLNGDIHPVNLFLDGEGDLKVGDWAGASIDGGTSHSGYRERYQLCCFDEEGVPRKVGVSLQTEIFALGSLLFHSGTGREVWAELEPNERDEIRRRIAAGEWPDVSGMAVLGDVVMGCWQGRFASVSEVKVAVETERSSSFVSC